LTAHTDDLSLPRLGWRDDVAEAFAPHAAAGLDPARVVSQHRRVWIVAGDRCELAAELPGRLRYDAASPADLPGVGDWVAVEPPGEGGRTRIAAVLPRRSLFLRRAAGEQDVEQVVAANVDVVFLVTALGGDVNVRRLERYLTMAWESGADPVVVLSKSDLADDVSARLAETEHVAIGVPVLVVSARSGEGMDALRAYVVDGRTIALLGSSGVGKSTLVNHLLGEERQAVRDARADGRGRHTTTRRELIPVRGGGLLLDTPGMRELQLWDSEEGVERAFEDVAGLAAGCRFTDCVHEHEPGCAVLAAVEAGDLAPERLESYRKLQRELAALARRADPRAAAEYRRFWRRVHRAHRQPRP
jgi:ribosome biogenesis GTPase / thiamine phosphate phosphatase